MEDIKVGEYIRSNKSGIHKVYRIKERAEINKYLVDEHYDSSDNDLSYYIVKTTEIVKHSTNLIDLIEVGDFVNGEIITGTYIQLNKKHIVNTSSSYGLDIEDSNDIRKVLTKEQYNLSCYRNEV